MDTGPLIAWVDGSEPMHQKMSHILIPLARYLTVPDAVVVEADALLRSRISPQAARFLLEKLQSLALRRASWDDHLYRRSVQYDASYPELGLGLVDASVMALAERERAPILTFDYRDFRATRPLGGGFWRLVVDEQGRVSV